MNKKQILLFLLIMVLISFADCRRRTGRQTNSRAAQPFKKAGSGIAQGLKQLLYGDDQEVQQKGYNKKKGINEGIAPQQQFQMSETLLTILIGLCIAIVMILLILKSHNKKRDIQKKKAVSTKLTQQQRLEKQRAKYIIGFIAEHGVHPDMNTKYRKFKNN